LRGDADNLPAVTDWKTPALTQFATSVREQALLEERRLGYVAATRAKRLLVASGHWWGRTQKRLRGPSDYLETLGELSSTASSGPWVDRPADDATNPLIAAAATLSWPAALDEPRLHRRRLAAQAVRNVLAEGPDIDPRADALLAEPAQQQLATIDAEIDALIAESAAAESDTVVVNLPPALSATAALRLRTDPDGLAAELARPMPRRPSRAARFGTRFHAWVESHVGQQVLLEPYDLPGAADADISDDADLQALTEAFRHGPFGDRRPVAVEAPFSLSLRGQLVVGRIDAVYEEQGGWCVVDWKTNREATADPTQLAIYRLAWAEMHGLPLQRVRAAFYYVRSGEVVSYPDLPDRDELETSILGGRGQ